MEEGDSSCLNLTMDIERHPAFRPTAVPPVILFYLAKLFAPLLLQISVMWHTHGLFFSLYQPQPASPLCNLQEIPSACELR